MKEEKRWKKINYLKHISRDNLYLQLVNFKSQYSPVLNCFNAFFQQFLKEQIVNNNLDKLNIPQLYIISEQLNKLNEDEFVQMTVYCQEQLAVLDASSLEYKFYSQYLIYLIEMNMKAFLISLTKEERPILSAEHSTGFNNIDQYLYYQRRIQTFVERYFSFEYSRENDVFQALQQIIQLFITQYSLDNKGCDMLSTIKQTAFYINYSLQLQKSMSRTTIIRDKQFNYIHIENLEAYLQHQQRLYFKNRLENLFKRRVNRFVDIEYSGGTFRYALNKSIDEKPFIYDNFGCLMKEDEIQLLLDELTEMKREILEKLNKDENFFLRLLRQKGGNLYKLYMDRKTQLENDLKFSELEDKKTVSGSGNDEEGKNDEIVNEELNQEKAKIFQQQLNLTDSERSEQPEIYQQIVQESNVNSSINQSQISDDFHADESIYQKYLQSDIFQTTVVLTQSQEEYFNKQILNLAKLELCLNQFIKYQLIYSDEYTKIMNIVIKQHFIVKDPDEKPPQLETMDHILFNLLNINYLKPQLQLIEAKLNQIHQAVQNISQLQRYMHKNKYHREKTRFKKLCMCIFVLQCKIKHYLEIKQFEIQSFLDKYQQFSLQYMKEVLFIEQIKEDFGKLVTDISQAIQIDKQFIHLFHRINDFLNDVNQFLVSTERTDLSEMTQEQLRDYEFNNANQIVRLITVYQRVLNDVTVGLGIL